MPQYFYHAFPMISYVSQIRQTIIWTSLSFGFVGLVDAMEPGGEKLGARWRGQIAFHCIAHRIRCLLCSPLPLPSPISLGSGNSIENNNNNDSRDSSNRKNDMIGKARTEIFSVKRLFEHWFLLRKRFPERTPQRFPERFSAWWMPPFFGKGSWKPFKTIYNHFIHMPLKDNLTQFINPLINQLIH